jgi:hypothetical protein
MMASDPTVDMTRVGTPAATITWLPRSGGECGRGSGDCRACGQYCR